MTAETEEKIFETIEQAESVSDPLEKLVEKAKTDPGVAFKPDVLACLADLEKEDFAQFHQLRSELKKVGVPVAKLDKAIAELNGHVRRRGPTQAEILIELAGEAELFHTPHLEARARFEAPECDVHLRVASHDGLMYVDLADDDWRAIEIGPGRWKVVENPPVRFRRAPGMLPLPEPEPGAGIEELLPFLNVSRSDAVLIAHWLINSLLPCPSYPVLVLQGEQGSAKSGTSRLLRALVDPNVVPLRALPRNERELLISAVNGHVLAFDNVSTLPEWMADALCRLATGGGFT